VSSEPHAELHVAREAVVAWRVARDERDQDLPAGASADLDVGDALRNWARALADRIEVLSDQLEVPLSRNPEHADLVALQELMEQLPSDWGPFLADEDSVLRAVDEGYWERSSKKRERAAQAFDTFLRKLDGFQRLLGAVDLQRKLNLADDLEQAARNLAFLQKSREEFARELKTMITAVVPVLRVLEQLT
jgi:hypothetical protein